MVQSLLKIDKRHVFVNIEAFYLMENAMGTGRDGFISKYASGGDNANGHLSTFHGTHLNARRVGTKKDI